MCLGALVDAGLSFATLKKGLKLLKTNGYHLYAKPVHRGTIQATKVEVKVRQGFERPLSLPTIRRMIKQSLLPSRVKTHSLKVFQRLAEAESAVHGVPQTKFHFHEVGVVDSLVDVVGTLLGIEYLGVTSASASPINVGSGTILTAHGELPVPGPAVAQLAQKIPIYAAGPRLELTTPTGMAIISVLTQNFGPLPPLTPTHIGYGAGTANPDNWANALRVFMAKESSQGFHDTESILEIHTTIDDLNPQAYESVMERLFQAGALDVTLTPVIMKRSRPGIILSVLVPDQGREAVIQCLLQETTTLGVRIHEVDRTVLHRRLEKIQLPEGKVRIKIADIGEGREKIMPEYRDCQSLAKKTGKPVREVIDSALEAYRQTTRGTARKAAKTSR